MFKRQSKDGACKRQVKDGTHTICDKFNSIVNDGIIAVHRYNATLFVECMAVLENNCKQASFATGCSIRITQSKGHGKDLITLNQCANLLKSTVQQQQFH